MDYIQLSLARNQMKEQKRPISIQPKTPQNTTRRSFYLYPIYNDLFIHSFDDYLMTGGRDSLFH